MIFTVQSVAAKQLRNSIVGFFSSLLVFSCLSIVTDLLDKYDVTDLYKRDYLTCIYKKSSVFRIVPYRL